MIGQEAKYSGIAVRIWSMFYIGVMLSTLFPSVSLGQEVGSPKLRFGIIADVQYADKDDAGSRNYRGSIDKLAAAVDTFNAQGVDFVINLGDFIDGGASNFDTLLSITGRL